MLDDELKSGEDCSKRQFDMVHCSEASSILYTQHSQRRLESRMRNHAMKSCSLEYSDSLVV
jgi:hypothetical protein